MEIPKLTSLGEDENHVVETSTRDGNTDFNGEDAKLHVDTLTGDCYANFIGEKEATHTKESLDTIFNITHNGCAKFYGERSWNFTG